MDYINLTNGLEAIETLPKDFSFVRIQSTACEQKRWGHILDDLPYNFLIDLAQGNCCIVHDFSQKKEHPRAIYQGLPWIRYALTRCWFNVHQAPFIKGNNVSEYFCECYNNLNKKTITRLRYVWKLFGNTDEVHLFGHSKRTQHDGNYQFYRELALKGASK